MCKNKTVTFCTFFVCRLTYTKRYTFLNGKTKEISNNITIISYGIPIIHETTVIGTADGKETFEVRKQYNVEGKSAIIYKKNLYSAREQISKNTKCSYSIEQVKTILKLIKPIIEKSKVEEVRTLIHLMIEEITIDRKTRSVDTISIKFNRQLTEYLCLQEGASKQVSFFSDLKEEELAFVLRL